MRRGLAQPRQRQRRHQAAAELGPPGEPIEVCPRRGVAPRQVLCPQRVERDDQLVRPARPASPCDGDRNLDQAAQRRRRDAPLARERLHQRRAIVDKPRERRPFARGVVLHRTAQQQREGRGEGGCAGARAAGSGRSAGAARAPLRLGIERRRSACAASSASVDRRDERVDAVAPFRLHWALHAARVARSSTHATAALRTSQWGNSTPSRRGRRTLAGGPASTSARRNSSPSVVDAASPGCGEHRNGRVQALVGQGVLRPQGNHTDPSGGTPNQRRGRDRPMQRLEGRPVATGTPRLRGKRRARAGAVRPVPGIDYAGPRRLERRGHGFGRSAAACLDESHLPTLRNCRG